MAKLLTTLQQDSELLYRSVFESTLEGMELIDAETRRVVTANQAMANIFGFASPEEMVGLNPLDYIPTEDRDRVARMIDEDMFQNNLRLVIEIRAMTRDGRELWLSALGVRIEHQGRFAGLISVRDITTQKLREKKIEASKEETRLLVENAGKAIVVVQDGVIKFANSKTTELTGYPEKDLVSSPFTEFIHPDDQSAVAELYLQSLKGEEVPQGSIVRSIGKEGTVIWFGLKAVSFTWDEKPAVWLLMNDITERKKAEDSLRESEKRYRLLAENASDVIWVTDMNMRPTYLSPSVTRLLGYSMEEAMARGMQESLTPASLKAAADAVLSAMDAERKGQKDAMSMIPALELEMVRKDGSILWVASTVSFISGPDGHPMEMMGVTRDITERKKAEEVLQSNVRHFRALIENSSDAIIVVNRDGTNRYVSPSTGRMLGYESDERIGASIFESVHPDDVQLASDEFVRLLQNPGAASSMEVRIQHKDGIWHTIEAKATNLFHDPAVEGIVVNLRDVTERKKAEEALQHQELHFRALIENSSDALIVTDLDGTTRYVSPSLKRMLGEGRVGAGITESVHPDDIQLVADSFASLLQTPGATSLTEVRIRHKDGNWHTTESTATNLLHDPAVEGIVINLRDVTERKKAHQDLEQSEKKYRQLVETVNEGIWSIDKDSNTTFVNPRMAEMLGYTIEEMIGKHLFAFMDERGVEIAKCDLERRQRGIKERHDFEFLRKDGARIYASMETGPIIDDKGEYAGAIAGVQDITERRKTETALAESEKRYRFMAENVSDVIWVIDMNLRPTYLSPSITKLTGYSLEETMARGMEKGMTPAALEAVAEIVMAELARKGEPNSATPLTPVVVEMERKDGSKIWAESAGTLLRGPDGQPVEIIGMLHDITERKKAEEMLQRREQRFRALTEHSSDVILIVSAEGTIRYVTPSVEPLLGFKPEQALGTNILEYLDPDALLPTSDEFAKVLQNPGATMQTEIRIQHKDGTWRTLEAAATNLLHDPAVEGIVINYRDITERRRAEEELKRQERHFRALTERSSDVIVVLDKNGTARYVSPSVEHALGITPAQSEGVGFLTSIHPDDVRQAAEDWDYLLKHPGGTTKGERRIRRPDGSWSYVEAIGYNLLDDPSVEGVVVNMRDINEHKQAEKAIRESEKRYRLLAENLSDVIWTMDTDLKYSYISPSITHLRGYTVEEALTISMEEMMTPASLEAAMRIMAEEDAKEHTGQYDPNRTITMEVELYRKDGSTVWAENAVTYLRDSSGRITGYQGVSRDITERREATRRLEQSFQNLEKAMDGSVQAIALTVESRDRYTAGHQKRVAQLGCAIARKLGYSSDQIRGIRIAALLHDIGKISVPQEILSKPGMLTDVEFRLIKTHSQTGYDILKSVEFPWPIADMVVQHHERMDGSGYPSGIREDKLLMEARILAVADVVEAMSSHRPYRAPLGVDKALEEISRNSGILYDPGVVDACMWVFNDEGFKFED